MKITPFWKLYGKKEKGLCVLDVYFSKFTYMKDYDFWKCTITILNNKIEFKLFKANT